MKTAFITIDPTLKNGKTFKNFSSIINHFQSKGFFNRPSIISVINPSLYPVPLSWYKKAKDKYRDEAKENIHSLCQNAFEYTEVKILQTNSSSNEDIVNEVSRYSQRNGHKLLVASSNDKEGLPRWFLGSFSETAALTASTPVLIIKPSISVKRFSKEARFILAADVSALPTTEDLKWIVREFAGLSVQIDIVYVEQRSHFFADLTQIRKEKKKAVAALKTLERKLKASGIKANAVVLTEQASVAQTLNDYAEKRKAWGLIAVSAQRSFARRLFLGHMARRLLALTDRPFLSLRFKK